MRLLLLPNSVILMAVFLTGCGEGSAAVTMRLWNPAKKELPQPVNLRSAETAKTADAPTKPPIKIEAAKVEVQKAPPPPASAKTVAVEPPSPPPAPVSVLHAQGGPVERAVPKEKVGRTRGAGREFTSRKSIKFKPAPSSPEGLPSWFKERDKDGDGQIGLYEWPEEEMSEFSKYDRNQDGFASANEILRITNPSALAAKPATTTETKPVATDSSASTSSATKSGSSPGSPSSTSSSGSSWGNLFSSFGRSGSSPSSSSSSSDSSSTTQSYFKSMDKNSDGKMSKEEYPSYYRTPFADIDTNKDGFIDLDEFTKYRQNRESDRGSFRSRRGWGF